jgi:nitrate/TMAO reductase-like tetraheme cytochrome c subunit
MKKINIVGAILAVMLCVVYLQCTSTKITGNDPRGEAYAGSATCIKCHSNIYKSYLHTAHYIAAVPANEEYVHGNFAKDHNSVVINPHQTIVMEKHGKDMYQTLYQDGKAVESHKFDIVLGGVKGESYLYWADNSLYQLPISYFTQLNEWLVSPGYVPGTANFARAIKSRCLECHASYIQDMPNATSLTEAEQFDKSSAVLSVDCERCHGPGAQHAAYQTENPQEKIAKFMVSYRSLSRAQRMDMCGVCHSGNKSEMLRSTFAFKPGDTLAKFKLPDFVGKIDTANLDVHGNQLQLLESSKCFINSNIDCATCHNTHQNQKGQTAIFAQKCLSCHNEVKHTYCKLANSTNTAIIKSNCIQCHMPALASRAIIAPTGVRSPSSEILVHTHHIAIYPGQVQKVLGMVLNSKPTLSTH